MSALLKKPRKWAFEPGIVAPEWAWFWDSLLFALPLWEGAGKARDYSGNGHHATLTGMPWVATPIGLGADNNSDGDELGFDDKQVALDISATAKHSFFCVIDVDSYNGTNAGFFRAGSTSNDATFFITNAGAGLWLRFQTVDVFKDSYTLGTGRKTFGFSHSRSAPQDGAGYLDGVKRSTGTGGGSNPTSIYQLGWQSATSQRIDGRWQAAYLWNKWLGDEQHAQLHRDPFGPFRMVDEAAFFVLAPPVGAISDYRFRQRYFG